MSYSQQFKIDSGNGLVLNRSQAVIWTNFDQVPGQHWATMRYLMFNDYDSWASTDIVINIITIFSFSFGMV